MGRQIPLLNNNKVFAFFSIDNYAFGVSPLVFLSLLTIAFSL